MSKHMSLKTLLLVTAIAALPTIAAPARAAVDVYVNVAPPERVEVVPAPRTGYIWAPGYYRWRGNHHVWVDGHWARTRVGYHWYADRWDHDGDRWIYRRGHWEL